MSFAASACCSASSAYPFCANQALAFACSVLHFGAAVLLLQLIDQEFAE